MPRARGIYVLRGEATNPSTASVTSSPYYDPIMAPNLLQHQNKCQLSSSIDHIHDDELESRAFEKRDNPFESTVVNESKCDPINVESQVSVLRRLKIAAFVCSVFLVVELIGGAVAGSLAVLSDAAHRATDLMAYIVFILGSYVATLPASKNYTFGLKRAESIVALFTMFSVAAISISLAIEAILQIWRFIRTPREMGDMDAKMMFILASIGVAINIILVPILKENHVHFGDGDPHSHCHSHGGSLSSPLLDNQSTNAVECNRKHDHVHCTTRRIKNVNLNAAYIHALADLAGSVALLIAASIIWWKPTWQIADPICSLIFSVMVLVSTFGVIKSTLSVLMEKVPSEVNWDEIYNEICRVPGVSNIHDLHIWSVSHGCPVLSLHAAADNVDRAYYDIKKICHKHKILKMTLQIQSSSFSDGCITCIQESNFEGVV